MDEISPFIIRSQCLLRLGRATEALEDANTAMDMDRCSQMLRVKEPQKITSRTNPRALTAKGEALYAVGQFEIALVHFERGVKLRQSQNIKDGLKKCREAILLTLGKSAKFDERIVKKVVDEPLNEKNSKKTPRRSKSRSMKDVVKRIHDENRKDKKLLGISCIVRLETS